jgi:hypothetical protein
MNDQSFALKLEGVFHRLQENLEGKEFRQECYDPDRQVYLLVVAGEQATRTHDFLAAVARYARALREGGGDGAAAKQEAVKALEVFAAKATRGA